MNNKEQPQIGLTGSVAEISSATIQKTVGKLAREWLAEFIAPKMNFGLPSLDAKLQTWRPRANYIAAGASDVATSALALTLAEKFATSGGHVIFIGTACDFPTITERLLLRDAKIEHGDPFTLILLDDAGKKALTAARDRFNGLEIEFCDIDDCGDDRTENDFFTKVASETPTLVVIEKSVCDEHNSNAFDSLVRRIYLLRVLDRFRISNPNYFVLWQQSVTKASGCHASARPTLSEWDDTARIPDGPDVIMFACEGNAPNSDLTTQNPSELIIAKNLFGATAILPMQFQSEFSNWCEHDD